MAFYLSPPKDLSAAEASLSKAKALDYCSWAIRIAIDPLNNGSQQSRPICLLRGSHIRRYKLSYPVY
ncbi:hypothetical protein BHE90_017018 [Fusarium euwallaceae]|uniref:Uncharacterized protein n=1 Tax=Fusarium euwallaceae TaxID=1147111 RepID=A0A430KYR4_9HYPO|nr:hypothetical protein BHE90_017018 [Fusarium euwallaceae]